MGLNLRNLSRPIICGWDELQHLQKPKRSQIIEDNGEAGFENFTQINLFLRLRCSKYKTQVWKNVISTKHEMAFPISIFIFLVVIIIQLIIIAYF